jgi:hypothetical protein
MVQSWSPKRRAAYVLKKQTAAFWKAWAEAGYPERFLFYGGWHEMFDEETRDCVEQWMRDNEANNKALKENQIPRKRKPKPPEPLPFDERPLGKIMAKD